MKYVGTFTPNQDLIYEFMGKAYLCGCGSGTSWELVLEMLKRIDSLRSLPDAEAAELSMYKPARDASARWVEFAAHVLDGWELVEHGSAIGWPWLTPKGTVVKEFLEEHGTDDSEWPSWAYEREVAQ